jgi:DNA-binding response OmpR family regulator
MTSVRKIVIVDDDAAVRDFLVEHLALHDGIEATAVESGAKGMQAVRAGQIDLVIMDIGSPMSTGERRCACCERAGSWRRSSC